MFMKDSIRRVLEFFLAYNQYRTEMLITAINYPFFLLIMEISKYNLLLNTIYWRELVLHTYFNRHEYFKKRVYVHTQTACCSNQTNNTSSPLISPSLIKGVYNFICRKVLLGQWPLHFFCKGSEPTLLRQILIPNLSWGTEIRMERCQAAEARYHKNRYSLLSKVNVKMYNKSPVITIWRKQISIGTDQLHIVHQIQKDH